MAVGPAVEGEEGGEEEVEEKEEEEVGEQWHQTMSVPGRVRSFWE